MSETKLIIFRDGIVDDSVEFANAWGGAARIWDSLYNKYCKDPSAFYDSWLSGAAKLWPLYKDARLAPFEKSVLLFTLDLFYVKKENFITFAQDLNSFADKYPVEGKVCHLRGWADVFNNTDCDAIGLHATSVGDNLWLEWDGEKEESVSTPLSEGEEVYMVLAQQLCRKIHQ